MTYKQTELYMYILLWALVGELDQHPLLHVGILYYVYVCLSACIRHLCACLYCNT